jgi:hypothetical protein
MCFLTVKISLLSIVMIMTIYVRRKKYGKYDFVTALLCLNVIMILGLFAWEVGTKFIWGFFIMMYMSNYINFMGFYMVIYQLRTPEKHALVKRTRLYLILMNVAYGIIAVASFTPWFGPFCTSKKLYPPVLSWSEILQVINVIYHWYLHCNKYFLKWEEHPKIKEMLGNEADFGYAPMPLLKKVFTAQMSAYICFRTNISIVSIILQVMARFFIHGSSWLACTNGGQQWLYTTLEGSFFMIFHMMTILMQSVMVERVFYSAPHKLGYFKLI